MSLETDHPAVLARKNVGAGYTQTQQPNMPYEDLPTAMDPLEEGDGVDVTDVILAEIIVRATGGEVTFNVEGRSIEDSVFDIVNGGKQITVAAGESWKETIRCPTLAELAIRITAGTATSVDGFVSPCNG